MTKKSVDLRPYMTWHIPLLLLLSLVFTASIVATILLERWFG